MNSSDPHALAVCRSAAGAGVRQAPFPISESSQACRTAECARCLLQPAAQCFQELDCSNRLGRCNAAVSPASAHDVKQLAESSICKPLYLFAVSAHRWSMNFAACAYLYVSL